ncbi:MAG: hypothetical protein COC03_05520 [Robiginitomaculum sp.]|nr:MAG: hypothetical protein COC03_05520 [Robiginitomaculum sp.]PHQ66682.1 MAG: hypothetical protein COB92_07090 [Robiginitomaculum sp.]
MQLKHMLLITLCMLINACASTNYEQADLVETYPILSIQAQTELNKPVTIQRNDFLIKLRVTPTRIAKASEDKSVDIVGAGQFNINQGDHFFPAKSGKFGTVYCGYTNLHSNSLKTILNQGCLADQDENGNFETFLVRTGASNKDVSGFIYHDAEIAQVSVNGKQTSVLYAVDNASEKHAYQIAFRFKRIAKRKGEKYAVFDIVTKRPDEDQWSVFLNRDPIEIKFPKNTTTASFTTPMFTVEFSNLTNKSLTAVTTSVATQSAFGFKRSLKNSNANGQKPAYQVIGYGR